MKKSFSGLLLAGIIALLVAGLSGCLNYVPPAPPEPPEPPATPTWKVYDWTSDAATGTAPTDWINSSGTLMDDSCTITGGILNFIGTASGSPTYRYNFTTAPVAGWTMTLGFRAKANADYGWRFDLQGGYRAGLDINKTELKIYDSTSGIGTYTITGDAWHTYFLTFEMVSDGMNIKVYVDGNAIPVLSGKAVTVNTNAYIRFGDTSTSQDYQGSMDWIFWTFDGAYVPGLVTLPPGYSL